MPASYLPYEPDQDFLLPPSLREWLPPGHLAHFISDTVDALDLAAFHARYEKGGPRNQPFHPAMMVKVSHGGVQLAQACSEAARGRGVSAAGCRQLPGKKTAWRRFAAARERLEKRQREADLERGRDEDDDRRPRGKDGKPKGGRYKREFGRPEASDQQNFTDTGYRSEAVFEQLAQNARCRHLALTPTLSQREREKFNGFCRPRS
jgi:hypothetical protein